MTNPTDNTNILPAPELKEQSKKSLREFFQQKSVRNLVNVLVPSALAAILFPIFGPVVAGGAAAVAVQNGLKLLGIDFSADSISKILKPLEGKPIDESDIQTVLQDLLPKDKQVNEEATKAIVTMAPEIKEAALSNPKIDSAWLANSLATSLKDQGGMMAAMAPQINDLIQLDLAQLQLARDRLLADWSQLTQQVNATDYGEVSDIKQSAKGDKKEVDQNVSASGHGKISRVEQNYESDSSRNP